MMTFKKFALAILTACFLTVPTVAHANPDITVQDKNKAIVIAFYNLAFNDHKPTEAAAKFIGDQYVQHNPNVPNGVKPFTEYFEGYFKEHPESHVVIHHALADGDLVALHLNSKVNKADKGEAIVDLFRLKDGKIIEHWDVQQDVPATTVSGNTMFDDRAQ